MSGNTSPGRLEDEAAQRLAGDVVSGLLPLTRLAALQHLSQALRSALRDLVKSGSAVTAGFALHSDEGRISSPPPARSARGESSQRAGAARVRDHEDPGYATVLQALAAAMERVELGAGWHGGPAGRTATGRVRSDAPGPDGDAVAALPTLLAVSQSPRCRPITLGLSLLLPALT